MKIAVMGADALGGYFGGRLAAAGHEVTLIARGAHLAAIQRNGLRIRSPKGDPLILFAGVAGVAIAIVIDALAYRRLPGRGQKTLGKGIALSVVCGVLMGLFFYLVAAAMPPIAELGDPARAGMLTPYTALVLFALGLFLSSFVFNSIVMAKPPPVTADNAPGRLPAKVGEK